MNQLSRSITKVVKLPIVFLLLLSCASLCASAAAQDTAEGPIRERFIPADQFNTIFERSPQGVLLQREEFQELLKNAQQAQAKNANHPADIVVRSADYSVEQADNHAVVTLTLDIEQFRDGWAALTFAVGNLLVESASIGEDSAAIGTDPKAPGVLTLVHRKVGRFSLTLTLSTPLGTVGSDRVAAFRTISNVASVVKVSCPAKQHLEVGNLKLQRPTPLAETAEYQFPVGGNDSVRLKWTTRRQQAETQTLVFARTDAIVKLSSDDLRWDSTTRVSVFGNAINQLIARVPTRLEVTAVDSTGLESWKLEDDPDRKGSTRLVLDYRQPFTEDRQVSISAIAPTTASTSSNLPTLEFIEVTSHTGRLLVHHEDQLRLMADVGGGVRHLGTQPQSSAKAPAGEIFDFWLQDFTLSVAVKPRDRELFAELNSTLSIDDTKASFTCDATIESLNAPLFEIPLQLPEGWQISYVTGADKKLIKWRAGNSDGQIVLEPRNSIPAGGLLTFKVVLTRTISDPAEPQQLTLPVLTAADTLVVGGTYRIVAASDLIISPQNISGLSTIGDDGGTLLFETQGTDISGQLSIIRKPVRLASRAVLKSWMDTRQKTVEAIVTVDVINGTTRTLTLQLPEDLGPDLRFSVVSVGAVPGVTGQQFPSSIAIIEQTSGAVVDGARPFTLTFDKRFVGAVTIKTVASQPKQDDTKLSAPFVRVVDAVRQHGLVAFEAYPEQQLKPVDADVSDSGLTIADSGLIDAPVVSSGRRTALVYRFVQPEYSLVLNETRFETEAVPSAVCESIANVSVLGDSGMIQRSCRVNVRCVGVQTLRFTLPNAENSYLWSTILNNQAVEVRRDGEDYLVAIPSEHNGSQHVLEVLFQSIGDDVSLLGETAQESLKLLIDTDAGAASAIDILEQTWDVRYPNSSMLVNHDGGFHPLAGMEKPGWLQSIKSLTSLPSIDVAKYRLIPVGAFLICSFILTALIIRRRWKSLLCVILLGVFVLPLVIGGASYSTVGGTHIVFESARTNAEFAGDDVDMDMPAMQKSSVSGSEEGLRDESDMDMAQTGPNVTTGGAFGGGGGFVGGSSGGFGGLPPGSAGGLSGLADLAKIEAFGELSDVNGGQQGGQQNGQQGLQRHTIRNQASNGIARDRGSILFSDNAAPVDGGVQLTLPGRMLTEQKEALKFDFGREYRKGKNFSGAARLSIRAKVAQPDDYQSMRFRSIGSTPSAGRLTVVVKHRSYFEAIRIIAAGVILLICVWISSTSFVSKACFAVTSLLVAVAAAALVPNQWQSAVDGIALGTLCGIVLWLVRGLVCWLKSGCCRGWRAKPAAAATAALVVVTLLTSEVGHAAPQESKSGVSRPDVVLPYTPGEPELLADRVFLPRKEFLKLYNQAYPEQLQKSAAPTTSQVIGAFYQSQKRTQIKDTTWSQSFKVRYVIRSFTEDVNVRLPISGIAVRSAMLDENTAILQAESPKAIPLVNAQRSSPNQVAVPQVQQRQQLQVPIPHVGVASYSVRIPSPGLHLLDVIFEVPAKIENSVGSLHLALQPVVSGTLVFELSDDELEAKINGSSTVFRRSGKSLTLPIGTAGTTRIQWQPKSAQSTSDTIYHSTVNSSLLLNDAGLTVHSTAKIHCRQGQLSEVEINLPADYAVQNVSGTDIAGWNPGETNADSNSVALKVLFRSPVTKQTKIDLTLFKKQTLTAEAATLDAPIPAVLGASRDSGNVTVLTGSELEVRVHSLSGVSQMNAAESVLPENANGKAGRVLAWRYTRHPAKISVRAFRTQEKLAITVLNGVQLESQRQLWTTLVSARISGAPRRRLEIRLPKNFLALSVDANDLADWYYTDQENDSDTKTLNIQFATARKGTINAVIQGQIGRESTAAASAKLIAPEVFGADETKTHVSLWLDAASEIASSEAVEWKRTGSETRIDSRILKLKPSAPDISFTSQAAKLQPITLSLRQAPASLIAESVTVTNVTDTDVKLTLGLNWQISGAATRELSFVIPGDLNEILDFEIPGLRQMEKEPVADGFKVTLHLQQPVSKSFFVLGTGTLPVPESNQILAQPPRFAVQESSKANIASQAHFWVIVNQSDSVLQAVDVQTDGEDVNPDEIKTNIPAGFLQQSVAIRRLKSDSPNSPWQLRFPKRQEVAPAVVALAAHSTIIAQDGTWRSRHDLQVRNESRQFLPLILPDNSRLLFCLVKNKPTRVVSRTVALAEGEQTLHLIPVPQSGELATPFDVQFALAGALSETVQGLSGKAISIPVPSFPEFRDFPEYGIMVTQNTWSVHLPKEWQANLQNNPRVTNVVPATGNDFTDVSIFASVDNVKSMLNSLSSSRGSSNKFGNTNALWAEVNRQKQLLEQQKGNNRLVEQQRTDALKEINDQLSRSNREMDFKAMNNDDFGGVRNGAVGITSRKSDLGLNGFLERQEGAQNYFFDFNNQALIQGNVGSGVMTENAPKSGITTGGESMASGGGIGSISGFRFRLPENQEREKKKNLIPKFNDETRFGGRIPTPANESLNGIASKKSKAAPAKPSYRNNEKQSQLLNRRELNVQQQAHKSRNKAQTRAPTGRQLSAPAVAVPEQPNYAGARSVMPQEEAAIAGDSIMLAAPVAPTGVLSLNFEIPQDGIRHDFVRTGGNATLSLTIRSTNSVNWALGVGWAIACLMAAIVLLKAASSGSGSLAFWLIILTAVAGLVGWLCLPPSLRDMALTLCIVTTACACIALIGASFRTAKQPLTR